MFGKFAGNIFYFNNNSDIHLENEAKYISPSTKSTDWDESAPPIRNLLEKLNKQTKAILNLHDKVFTEKLPQLFLIMKLAVTWHQWGFFMNPSTLGKFIC